MTMAIEQSGTPGPPHPLAQKLYERPSDVRFIGVFRGTQPVYIWLILRLAVNPDTTEVQRNPVLVGPELNHRASGHFCLRVPLSGRAAR